MNLKVLTENILLPPWAKYVAIAVLITAVWGHGFVKGIERSNDKAVAQDVRVIYKQGKVTEKVITVYKDKVVKQKLTDVEIKDAVKKYQANYPNDGYSFNNEYVWLHDNSIKGSISPLPNGELGDSSGISVSQALSISVHNNTVGREWKERALTCEKWTKEQEELHAN